MVYISSFVIKPRIYVFDRNSDRVRDGDADGARAAAAPLAMMNELVEIILSRI